MIKVLFTTPILEYPATGGPALRVEASIKALSRVSELYVISRNEKDLIGREKVESFYKGFCREFTYIPSARVSANRYIRRIEREWRQRFSLYADSAFISDLADKHKIDIIWCGHGSISFRLIRRIKAVRPDLKIVFDTDSVWSRFVLRELSFECDPKRRKKIEREGRMAEFMERKAVDLCEVTTAVSEVDAEHYRGISAYPERVMAFPNVIDLAAYENIPSPVPGFKKPCVCLVGTFGHLNSPMDRAARWMIEEILPKVKKEVPEVHFYMIGKDSDVVWGGLNDSSVTVTGKLPSVLPYLCHADAAVVPLQFESGTRFKILEAGACGVPVVSTTLGAEGLPVTHEQEILLADTPEDFAGSVVRLIKDKNLADRLRFNCRKLVKEKYTVENLQTEAKRILERLDCDNEGRSL